MVSSKNAGAAFALWALCLVGLCGMQRFYMGKYGTGVLWLLTFGVFGIGQFVDLFLINGWVEEGSEDDRHDALLRAAIARTYAAPGEPTPPTA